VSVAPYARPPRCTLANVETGETMVCAFNPTELTERVEVNYQRLGALGQGFEQLQYTNTKNRTIPNLEFYADGFQGEEITRFRDFLRALTAPAGDAPPGVLFIWPRVLSIEGVVTDLEFKYTQFGTDGAVLIYTATLTLEAAERRTLLQRPR
jgi:hypothetical protein